MLNKANKNSASTAKKEGEGRLPFVTEVPDIKNEGGEKSLSVDEIVRKHEAAKFRKSVIDVIGKKKEAEKMAVEARQEARIDALTGLPNLKSYRERVAIETAQALRHGYPLTLMMIDIDDFKNINDTKGHKAGDDAIKAMTKAVSRNLRVGDFMARVGGEEFVIVLPHSNVEQAAEVSNKLQAALRDALKDREVKFTISGGFVSLGSQFSTPDSLKEAADLALYQAKAKGKDRIFEYDETRVITKSEIIEVNRQRIKRGVSKELTAEDRRGLYQTLLDEANLEIQEKVTI